MSSHQKPWSEKQIAFLRENYLEMPHEEIARRIGKTRNAVRGKAHLLGLRKKEPPITEAEEQMIRDCYEAAGDYRPDVESLSKRMGRSVNSIQVKASRMGLGKHNRLTKGAKWRQDNRMFKGDAEALARSTSERMKKHFAKHGHPRGMAGKKHTDATRKVISKTSKERWQNMTEEERLAHTDKMILNRMKNGYAPPATQRGSWNAGWREIGDRRIYFRSLWEANYARYLEWLKQRGDIREWEYEPKTFWFEKIKRGVRSYKPDFLVTENNGDRHWHEVKGWMDDRSRVTLKRMAKYYPEETVKIIDQAVYKSIRLQLLRIIPDWEDSPRDNRLE